MIKPAVFTAFMLLSMAVQATSPVRLHSLGELNGSGHALNSHAGAEGHSVLEPIYDCMQLIPASHLQTSGTAIYPRVKKMADGRYILFCQGGQVASSVYYYTSSDLKTWSPKTLFLGERRIETVKGPDKRCYTTADAVVLQNGDLLVACSYRSHQNYKNGIDCGIVLRRSRDNGKTWSDEQVIFEGTNWEPYLLQLPDGRVQCYFTDCNPRTRNSGTSVLTSEDNGHSWQGYKRICRIYKYDDAGEKIFTGQMPCFRVLNDGKTLFGFLEARQELNGPRGKSLFLMNTVHQEGFDWQDLGEETHGPSDMQNNLLVGCAGYVSTFPSGEVVISSNIRRFFSLKIGDATARRFNGRDWEHDWFRAFPELGFWGSLEPLDAHRLIGTMHCDRGIQLGLFYLNHRIDAAKARVKVDGDPQDWTGDQALFIGGDSPAQALFRAACDPEYVYLLAECRNLPEAGTLDLSMEGAKIVLNARKVLSAPQGTRIKIRKGLTAAGEPGFAAEMAIPRTALAGQGTELRFYAAITAPAFCDGFSFARPSDPDTWMRIRLPLD